jgi:HK97 gp10 family phage protein
MIVGKENLSKLLGNIADQKTAQKALKQACAYVELKAKEKAPKDTGELRNSIIYKVEGLTGEVGTNLEYAVYVHQGTGLYAFRGAGRESTEAHPIPWTYFDEEDGQFYTTYGQRANPFLEQALDESKPQIRKIFQSVIKEATNDRL